MTEKRSGLNSMWAKIEAIKARESKLHQVIGIIGEGVKSGLSKFDNFIEGNFEENTVIFLGKEYTDNKMISYANDLPGVMQKDNLSWLNSMAVDEVFIETLNVCPKLLVNVFEQEKKKGYAGLPISFNKSLKVQASIPALKFLTKNELLGNLLVEGTQELDINKVTKVIIQSQKNIDVLMEHIDSFGNFHVVLEKFPSLIKVFDQNILLDNKNGPKIINEINKAAENNTKVKENAEFYLSFFLDNDGKICEIKSKAEELRETIDPIEEKRKKALLNIKAITERESGTKSTQNPHITYRKNKM